MTRVLLVDDDSMTRRLLSLILGQQGIEVVGEATDGDEVVAAVQAHRPDVVLMDLGMPRVGGVEATAAVCALPDPPAVLALTALATDASVLAALQAGARGYLHKDAGPEEVAAAVEAVAAGQGALSPTAARTAVAHIAADEDRRLRQDAQQRLAVLSDRELEVAVGVARGLSNAQIAEQAFIGETTVKTLIQRATEKLGVEGRVQLAVAVALAGALRA